MVNDATGAPVSIEICKWCHDSTPARIGTTGVWAPNVLGDSDGAASTWATGTWGADVNGHGLTAGNYEGDLVGENPRIGKPAANKLCTVCHDARYTTLALPAANTPLKTHFDNANDSANKRLQGTINGVPTIADNPDNTCPACHRTASGADRASDTSQVVSHGNSSLDGYKKWEPDIFLRSCRQCHEPHGANWNGVAPESAQPPHDRQVGRRGQRRHRRRRDGRRGARVDSTPNDAVNHDTATCGDLTSAGGTG